MDGIAVFREAFKSATTSLTRILEGVTADQARYVPPGTANPIAPTLHHIVAVQDQFMNTRWRGVPTVWERDGWAAKLGLSDSMRLDPTAAGFDDFDPDAYRGYTEAVIAETDAWLATLTDADLDREIAGFRGPTTLGANMVHVIMNHWLTHTGEIAAVKGNQGLKGLP
jgi:uncharacterized damage-inducible protein DinB